MLIRSICTKAGPLCLAAALSLLVVWPVFGQETQEKFESEHEQEYRQAEFLATHSDDTGTPRPDLWRLGIEQFLEMRAALESGPSSPRLGTTWTQIGPQPLVIYKLQIYQGTGPDSGEVVDIAIDPSDNRCDPEKKTDCTVYVATNDGGIWKTTDSGTNWMPLTDFGCPATPPTPCPSLSMGAVALDPQNHQIVYAGTGNPFDGGDSFTKGVGIYKSTNGGASWTLLDPGNIFSGDRNHLGVAINRIAVWFHRPPGGTAVLALLVATSNGLFRSIDGGKSFGNNAPNYDNGKPVLAGYITDLKIESYLRPQAIPLVYAAVCTPDILGDCRTGVGIFQSADGGVTFTNLFKADGSNGAPKAGDFGFISFAQTTFVDSTTKLRKVRIYANISKRLRQRFGYGSLGDFLHLYRSDDGGSTWQVKPAADPAGNGGLNNNRACQCGYDQTIGVDPQDPDRVYIGFQELYLSVDGGNTFPVTLPDGKTMNPITRSQVHWDHHAIVFSPFPHWDGKPTRVWVGTDGGIASTKTAPPPVMWDNLNGKFPNNAIATNLFFQIDIGHGALGRLFPSTYGGTQDTGTIVRRPDFNGNDWHLASDGDGSPAAVDPVNPLRAYGASNGNGIFTENGGDDWTNFPAAAGLPSAWRYAIGANIFSMYIFAITSASRSSRETDGAPGPSLFRSETTGARFEEVFRAGANIRSIANTSANPNLLWLGLNDGTLRLCANALGLPPITCNAPPNQPGPNRPVGGITINPNDPNEVIVVYEGFSEKIDGSGHVFITRDGGNTPWKDIGKGSLMDLPTHSVVMDSSGFLPFLPNTIIVSNDAGVMAAIDNPAKNMVTPFGVLGSKLPIVDSKSLAIDSSFNPLIQSVLRLGTYGRSVWELK